MPSSRMRTGRTLTVLRCLVPGGGGVSPKKAEIKKKKSPKKIGEGGPLKPPNPEKIGDHPKNWRPPTPKKLETHPKNWRPLKNWRPPRTDLQGMLGYPSPLDRHTLVKILPWPKLRFGR